MKTDPFLEEHPVKLTEAEINDRSREAVRLVAELDALAETKREKAKRLKELGAIVDAGVEPRQVECAETPNLDTGMAETVRLDTHAIVSTRAMTAAEISEARQAQMFPDDELAGRRKKKSPTH